MQFLVAHSHSGVKPTEQMVVLESSTWDDYTYKTTFRAFLYIEPGKWVSLGKVKILHDTSKVTAPILPNTVFTALGPEFCSLGQSASYYEGLHASLQSKAHDVLTALGDIALSLPDRFIDHPGIQRSLRRFSDTEDAQNAARRIFGGEVRGPEGKIEFTLTTQLDGFPTAHVLNLAFPTEGDMLGRVAAIAGPNGSGKTQLLARLGTALSGLNLENANLEPLVRHNVVAISFNIFDEFTSPRGKVPGDSYRYYGLRAPGTLSQQRDPERSLTSPSEDVPPRPESSPVIDFNWAFERLRESLVNIWSTRESLDIWHEMLRDLGVYANEPDLPHGEPGESPEPFSVRGCCSAIWQAEATPHETEILTPPPLCAGPAETLRGGRR